MPLFIDFDLISVPLWAAPCLTPQARGTARARPAKVPNSEGTPRHAQGSLSIGTGTPNHMMGVPGRVCARACPCLGTDKARPGQSLDESRPRCAISLISTFRPSQMNLNSNSPSSLLEILRTLSVMGHLNPTSFALGSVAMNSLTLRTSFS